MQQKFAFTASRLDNLRMHNSVNSLPKLFTKLFLSVSKMFNIRKSTDRALNAKLEIYNTTAVTSSFVAANFHNTNK